MAEDQPDRNAQHKPTRLEALENCLTLVQNSLTGMAVIQDLRIVFANPEMVALMGYTAQEAAGQEISRFIHPDDRERVQSYYLRRINDEDAPEQYQFRAITKRGETRIFEMRPTIIEYNHRPGVLMNVIDITDRVLAEQALKDSEEAYRNLVERIYDWLWEVDEHLIYNYASPQIRNLLGLEPEEVLGRSPYDLMPLDEAARVRAVFDPILKRREPFTLLENTLVHADGHLVTVETSGRPVFDREGVFRGYRGIDRDITIRKQFEESLRSSEQRLADILNFLPDATFAIDAEGRTITWNREMERLTGVKAEDMLGKADHEYALPFYGERRAMLADLALRPREEIKSLYPFVTEVNRTLVTEVFMPSFGPRGAYLWSKASPLFDSKGNVVGAIESVRDVSERKRAEEQRRELERKLDAQKRQFYRETILSVTDGKLDISDAPEVAKHLARADRRIEVTNGSEAAVARHEAAGYLKEHGLSGDRLQDFIMGIGEAIANAVKHAGEGRVYLGSDDGELWVGIADKGKGIESLILPKATLLKGFSTKPSLGLGYSIMLTVADQILLKTGSRGTTVILFKKLQEPGLRVSATRLPDTWSGISDL